LVNALTYFIPIVAIVVSVVSDMFGECVLGVAFHSVLINAVVCVTTRLKELSVQKGKNDVPLPSSSSASNTLKPVVGAYRSICMLSALMGIAWMVVLCYYSPETDRDVFIPFSTLLVVCIKQNTSFNGLRPIAAGQNMNTF